MLAMIHRESDEQSVGVETVARYFRTDENHSLPVFEGGTDEEHAAVWRLLNRRDKLTGWCRGAVGVSLTRQRGHRTDRNESDVTQIQRFCAEVRISPSYFSRVVRTYNVFNELLAAESKTSLPALLADDHLSWTHLILAAHTSAPVEALIEARDERWSASDMRRMIAARNGRELLDAEDRPMEPGTDDGDLHVECDDLPERATNVVRRPANTRVLELLMTNAQHNTVAGGLRELAGVFGTDSDMTTLLATIERAIREWARQPSLPFEAAEGTDRRIDS